MAPREWSWRGETEVVETEVGEAEVVPVQQASHGGTIGWDGEKYPGGWTPGFDSFMNDVLELDYFTLRERSVAMFETNLYGRGIIRRLVTNEVHTGLTLKADPVQRILKLPEEQLEEWGDTTEAFWNAWAATPDVCHYDRAVGMTHGKQTAEARRMALVGGDVLIVLRLHDDTQLPTVQHIDGHLVRTPFESGLDTQNIEEGVELNAKGEHVAFHVWDPDTGTSKRIPARGEKSGRLQAWLMYGTDKLTGRVRGAPLLSIVMQSLREIDRHRDSTQRKALIQSILSIWVEKTEDKMSSRAIQGGAVKRGTVQVTDLDGSTPSTVDMATYYPGLVLQEMQQGEKVHSFKADGGSEVHFPEFEAAIVAAVAWANEMPPEILRLSFDSNYSASQASLTEFKLYLTIIRAWIAGSYNQPIYDEWLLASVQKGTLSARGLVEASTDLSKFETWSAWTNVDWIGAVKPSMDMLKTLRAAEIQVDRGWSTNTLVARETTGTDFAANARKLRKERELMPQPQEEQNALASLVAGLVRREMETHEHAPLDDPTAARD